MSQNMLEAGIDVATLAGSIVSAFSNCCMLLRRNAFMECTATGSVRVHRV